MKSSSFSFFEDIVSSFLLEVNFDVFSSQLLVSGFNSWNSLLQKVLIGLVQNKLGN